MRAELTLQIGDPAKDEQMLTARSPVTLAGNIRAPVLMAYGRQDPRVVIAHATTFESALKKANVPYELMVRKDEGHGYQKFGNQVDFGTKLVTFLETNLAPKAPGTAPAVQ
jgi:dipeptidyl aminopeptidase/acylaminoacyl peptidase